MRTCYKHKNDNGNGLKAHVKCPSFNTFCLLALRSTFIISSKMASAHKSYKRIKIMPIKETTKEETKTQQWRHNERNIIFVFDWCKKTAHLNQTKPNQTEWNTFAEKIYCFANENVKGLVSHINNSILCGWNSFYVFLWLVRLFLRATISCSLFFVNVHFAIVFILCACFIK